MDRDSLLMDNAKPWTCFDRSTSPGELAQAPMGGRKREREAGPDTYSPSPPKSPYSGLSAKLISLSIRREALIDMGYCPDCEVKMEPLEGYVIRCPLCGASRLFIG
jgi:hypothetical protein